MSLERKFYSYTKEDDQEYSVEVNRVDDTFKCKVVGKFGNMPPLERAFEAEGPDAEQKVQEFLYELDEEVRKLLEGPQAEEAVSH